jgi:hypothetical protein
MADQLTSAVPASQQPANTTGISEGPDGKMYFHDAAGRQLGLAPDNIQNDDAPPATPTPAAPTHPSGAFDFGFTAVPADSTQTSSSQSSTQSAPAKSGFDFGFKTPDVQDKTTLENFNEGVEQSAPVQILKSVVMPPESADEHIAAIAGGPGALIAYRQAKGIVNSVKTAMNASGTKFVQAVQDIKSAADQFHRGDYRNAASSAVSGAADVAGIVDPVGVGTGAGNVRELSEGARPGANLTTPLTRQIIDAGTGALGAEFGGEAGDSAESTATSEGTATAASADPVKVEATKIVNDIFEKNPIESSTAKLAAKSDLPTGLPERTPNIPEWHIENQQIINEGLRDVVNRVAKDDGLEPVQPSSLRDLVKDLGDQYFNRSKAVYQQVEDATGVNITDIRNKINTLNDKISNAVDNPELEDTLAEQRDTLEKRGADAMEQAKAQGIDSDQAISDWKKGNAAYDLGKQIRASVKTRGSADIVDTVNPGSLADRFHKMADSNSPTQPGRLQQLMGDHAESILRTADEGAIFDQNIKDLKNMPATGQQAMQDLLKQSTMANYRGAPKTYFLKALKNFDAMGPEKQFAQFGRNIPQARNFLLQGAKRQLVKRIGTGLTLGAIAHEAGVDKAALHALID